MNGDRLLPVGKQTMTLKLSTNEAKYASFQRQRRESRWGDADAFPEREEWPLQCPGNASLAFRQTG
jgi:hypothetical protein